MDVTSQRIYLHDSLREKLTVCEREHAGRKYIDVSMAEAPPAVIVTQSSEACILDSDQRKILALHGWGTGKAKS